MATPEPPLPTTVIPGAGWVDMATRVITQVGFPVVIAGVLLWFVLGTFQSSMNKIATHMEASAKALEAVGQRQDAALEELQKQTESLRTIAQEAQRPH